MINAFPIKIVYVILAAKKTFLSYAVSSLDQTVLFDNTTVLPLCGEVEECARAINFDIIGAKLKA